MYITFNMLKDLTISSYDPYSLIDTPNKSIYIFKCQNDIVKTVGVLDSQLYSDLDLIDDSEYTSPYHPEERISSKYQNSDIFKISHIELYPQSLTLLSDILNNGKIHLFQKYLDTVQYIIYLEKIDTVSDYDPRAFLSLNSYRDFTIKSLEKCVADFGEEKSQLSSISDYILDVLHTIALELHDTINEFQIDCGNFNSLSKNFELCIAAISYILGSRSFENMPILDIAKILKSIDFDNRMMIKEFIYKDILSYTKYESDKLTIHDVISRLPYWETCVIKDVFPEIPLFSIDWIVDDPDFLGIVLDELDFCSLQTTIRDMLYSNSNIYIIPGDGDDDKYYFYSGSISDRPVLEEDGFVESINNKKIYRQLTRVMRMRNHYLKLIKTSSDTWAFLVLSNKSYFKDYEDDEDISEWLEEDYDEPVSRILAIVGQRDGQQYSIIRKVF